MRNGRSSGVLLHPTCLPGPYGIGDVGAEALAFLDRLAAAGQSLWLMLPIHPPGGARSPYDARSTFAGDPLLLSPDLLVEDGLLPADALRELPPIANDRIRFEEAEHVKERLLRESWARFPAHASPRQRADLERFERSEQQAAWLEDWALYAALHVRFGKRPWTDWPDDLRRRDADALSAARRELASELAHHRYLQWLFERQWRRLHARAEALGVRLCGDLPIYVSHDSADVWARQDLFELDENGRPQAVAGVPPDAFTADGQLWGNPLYRWPRHREEGFDWWTRRLRVALSRVDLLRLDHFRAFAAYWRVPADAENARGGRWARGPGRRLFDAVAAELGGLPLIAEDLGVVTPAVRRLCRSLGVPGMRVVQFGFDSEDSEHRPDRCPADAVVYLGTHDNDTTRGWLESLDGERRARLDRYLGSDTASADAEETVWRLIEATFAAAPELAVVTLQDVLGLGSDARTNAPGTVGGNWSWRLAPDAFTDAHVERLRLVTASSDRLARSAGEEDRLARGAAEEDRLAHPAGEGDRVPLG